jgi:hypothetical protein
MDRIILELDSIPLDGPRSAAAILARLDRFDDPIFVVARPFVGLCPPGRLRETHLAIAEAMGAPGYALEAASLKIDGVLRRLSARHPARGPGRGELIASRSSLAAACVALAFAALGRPLALVEPVAPGRGFAAALRASTTRLPGAVIPGLPSLEARAVAEALGARLLAAEATPRMADYAKGPPLAERPLVSDNAS